MRIIKEPFQIRMEGKCATPEDIIELFNFGISVDGISKIYKKDNELKIKEARKFVETVLHKKAKESK